MFHTLHKIAIALLALLGVGLIALAYQQRHRAEPVVDWVDILRHRQPVPPGEREVVTGKVVRVMDGNSFLLRDAQGRQFHLRLTGVTAPGAEDLAVARASRQALSDLVLSNEVTVELTFLNTDRNGLGFVHLQTTNVNTTLASRGHVKVQREYIRNLRPIEQYRLLHAERTARAQKQEGRELAMDPGRER
jgi:endonuclease YncB( thermonuclease family)